MEDSSRLVRDLMRRTRCSVCEASFKPENFTILGYNNKLWFLSVHCMKCQTKGVLSALVQEKLLASPDRKHNQALVTEDDVAAMHEFLNRFEGGLRQMLTAD